MFSSSLILVFLILSLCSLLHSSRISFLQFQFLLPVFFCYSPNFGSVCNCRYYHSFIKNVCVSFLVSLFSVLISCVRLFNNLSRKKVSIGTGLCLYVCTRHRIFPCVSPAFSLQINLVRSKRAFKYHKSVTTFVTMRVL
jgi:hypothetical protein